MNNFGRHGKSSGWRRRASADMRNGAAMAMGSSAAHREIPNSAGSTLAASTNSNAAARRLDRTRQQARVSGNGMRRSMPSELTLSADALLHLFNAAAVANRGATSDAGMTRKGSANSGSRGHGRPAAINHAAGLTPTANRAALRQRHIKETTHHEEQCARRSVQFLPRHFGIAAGRTPATRKLHALAAHVASALSRAHAVRVLRTGFNGRNAGADRRAKGVTGVAFGSPVSPNGGGAKHSTAAIPSKPGISAGPSTTQGNPDHSDSGTRIGRGESPGPFCEENLVRRRVLMAGSAK